MSKPPASTQLVSLAVYLAEAGLINPPLLSPPLVELCMSHVRMYVYLQIFTSLCVHVLVNTTYPPIYLPTYISLGAEIYCC